MGRGLPTDCWLTYTYLLTDVTDQPASLGVTCGQHVEYLSNYLLSKPELPLQTSSYPNSPRCWVGTGSIHWPKIRNQCRTPFTISNKCATSRSGHEISCIFKNPEKLNITKTYFIFPRHTRNPLSMFTSFRN